MKKKEKGVKVYIRIYCSQFTAIDYEKKSADLGKKLVYYSISHTGSPTSTRASLLADGIELVKDDDVQAGFIALGFVLQAKIESDFRTHVVGANSNTSRKCARSKIGHEPPSQHPQRAFECSPPRHRRTC